MSNRHLSLQPRIGESRTMTRAEWKKRYQACRLLSPMIDSELERMQPKFDKALSDLMIYGFAAIEWRFFE